jgi:3-oxoacyl-[acyl-carrier-protein] synthase II
VHKEADLRPRAVVTGIGVVTPVGNGVDYYWSSLTAGRSGIGRITRFDTRDLPVQIGGEVKDLDASAYIPTERSRKMSLASKHAVVAARLALEDSGLEIREEDGDEIDVLLGVTCPDLRTLAKTMMRRSMRGASYAIPRSPAVVITGAPAANVAIELGIRGEVMTFSTGCSSSTNAIGHALRKIRSGSSSVVLTGGADSGVQIDLVAAFAKSGVLSVRNDDPEGASRPFEASRDGYVLSDAAAVLVLEEYGYARARGVEVYAEILGYGTTNDSYSMAEVSKDFTVAAKSISKAMKDACVNNDDVGYYCAHGTAARRTDVRETLMLKTALRDHAYRVPVSSIKSMIGLPLGASGALQTATCALSIRRGAVPPTINYEEPDPECDLDYVPGEARETRVRVAVNYALGMGGNNAALVVGAC